MFLPLLLLLLLPFSCSAATRREPGGSFHDLLRSNGLPIGIVPEEIKLFHLGSDGYFQLRLEAPCNARFEDEVHYDADVSGYISYGQISDLRGVSAQELFLWLPVKGIHVDVPSSGVIYFDVGVVRKQFKLSLFDTPPDCLVAVRDADVKLRQLASDDVAERIVM